MPTCHSTNSHAMDMIKKGVAQNGDIIITKEQTAGRGQRGNKWISESGKNLTFSFVLTSQSMLLKNFELNMAISLGIWRALNDFLPPKTVAIKWPNDLLVNSKKICGILIESVTTADKSVAWVVGIGLNVNQTEFNYLNATSMKNESTVVAFDLQNVLEKLALCIEESLEEAYKVNVNTLKNVYLSKLFLYNKPHSFKIIAENEYIEGKIVDIDRNGCLVIANENKRWVFEAKEVLFL